MAPDRLPLRGFILCSKCTRTLCGSASKGRNAYYHYYHCCSACGCRHKADEVNKSFTRELGTYLVNPKYEELYKQVILDKYLNVSKDSEGDKSGYIKQITSEHNRITKARELLLSDVIDGRDFKAVKTEAEHNRSSTHCPDMAPLYCTCLYLNERSSDDQYNKRRHN